MGNSQCRSERKLVRKEKKATYHDGQEVLLDTLRNRKKSVDERLGKGQASDLQNRRGGSKFAVKEKGDFSRRDTGIERKQKGGRKKETRTLLPLFLKSISGIVEQHSFAREEN